ncbi:unnamed protein product [Clonostachys chloroleuca]|uniref:Cytochrome P450 n=1 Tax=Clonostachys chloroleuca TaxID=1926264 RepID=A0AA35M687_9HYPO|nr:unnamed protein product [Clonostachys chloroleuca]
MCSLLLRQPAYLLGLYALIACGVAFCAVVYLVERFIVSVPYPDNIPLIREAPGARRFSLRTRWAYYTDCKALFKDAWDNYLKLGKPVVIPGMGFRKEVLLPPSMIRWVLVQPASRLNVPHAMAEMDQAKFTLGHDGPILDSWQGLLVKTELNRVLEAICASLNDELGRAFDKHFGDDEENWVEFKLRETISRAIAQANSRFTVGLPLCRDPEYLKTVLDINDGLLANGGLICGLPTVLQPLFGPIIGISLQQHISKVKRWLIPLWRERVAIARADEEDEGSTNAPLDHVQMMVKFALKERPEEINDHELIVRRICAQNFGAVHQTTLQVCNLLLDILGSDVEYDTINALRKESDDILGTEDDSDRSKSQWTKARVNSMVLADSVSRETLRLHAFANRAMMRKVMVDGVTTPEGYNLPKGTLASFLSYPVQTDNDVYPDALKYVPFRFVEKRDEGAPVTFVTTSSEYLPFGHGKHACPGRFLVDFELKMIVAHVLRNYDIKFPAEYEGKRPPNEWITEASFPPNGVRICVRKRKKT